MRKRYTLLYIWLCMLALCFSACHEHVVYHHYEPIANAEWEREDTLSFCIPAMKDGGNYDAQIELRADGSYPYQNLHMIVECSVMPKGLVKYDTLVCLLSDDKGHATGEGICDKLCTVPYRTMNLQAGDSLHVSILHHMRKECLPGIMDIGLYIRKANPHQESN